MPRFDTPLTTNDQSFDRVLHVGLPVALLIENGTTDPSLDEALRAVAKTDAGRLLVARARAADNPQIANTAAGSVPALILYREGQELTRTTSPTAASFRAYTSYLLGRGPLPAHDQPAAPPKSTAPTKPIIVTDATYQRDVLHSDLPVLVDLWAAWCGPCRMIAPIVEKLAGEYAGRMKFAKLNVDENPLTANQLQIRGIPTLLVYRGGKLVDKIVGAAPEPMLRQKIDAVLRG
ncbi:MAG TPA: thioredoxin [Aggregatilineaceae bacterium]|nr:thioredoxin [Aggregatilineaceae bacterium]